MHGIGRYGESYVGWDLAFKSKRRHIPETRHLSDISLRWYSWHLPSRIIWAISSNHFSHWSFQYVRSFALHPRFQSWPMISLRGSLNRRHVIQSTQTLLYPALLWYLNMAVPIEITLSLCTWTYCSSTTWQPIRYLIPVSNSRFLKCMDVKGTPTDNAFVEM